MSKLVTLDQKKAMMALGYPTPVAPVELQPRDINGDLMFPEVDKYDFHLTVSSALDWIRDNHLICWVQFEYCDGINWYGTFIKNDSQMTPIHTDCFDTHPLACSALLTAVLEYLIEKEEL